MKLVMRLFSIITTFCFLFFTNIYANEDISLSLDAKNLIDQQNYIDAEKLINDMQNPATKDSWISILISKYLLMDDIDNTVRLVNELQTAVLKETWNINVANWAILNKDCKLAKNTMNKISSQTNLDLIKMSYNLSC